MTSSTFYRPLAASLAVLLVLCCDGAAEETQGLVIPFKQVSVSSPVLQDVIAEIYVEEGDTVKQGQPLARLIHEKEELDVEQYAKLIERRSFEAKGMETLWKEKMASQESALEKLTDLELAKIQHKLALSRLNEKMIKAPLSGIVVKKYKEVGEGVERVEKLFDIVNIDQVFVQFYLDPKLMDRMKPDAKVNVRFPTLPKEKQEYSGTVSFIDPRIDAASGLFRVKVLIDNPRHEIKAGMRGQADFSNLQAAAMDLHLNRGLAELPDVMWPARLHRCGDNLCRA
jgi:membrane fusion protein (multidrug efflux system)